MSDIVLPKSGTVWDNRTPLVDKCCSVDGLHAMPAPLASKLARTIATMATAMVNDQLNPQQLEEVWRAAGAWAADDDVRAWVSLILRISEGGKL